MKAENGRIRGDLKTRTKAFAVKIVQLYSELPKKRESQVLGDQLLRSGTSVGAHIREAQRAKSAADFISKMEGGLQELEESGYWLELLEECQLAPQEQLTLLRTEVDELLAIFVTIVRKTKSNSAKQKS